MDIKVHYATVIRHIADMGLFSRQQVLYFFTKDEIIPDLYNEQYVYPNYEKEHLSYPTYIMLKYFADNVLFKDQFIIYNY